MALCKNDISQYRIFDKQYYRISDSLEHNETITATKVQKKGLFVQILA